MEILHSTEIIRIWIYFSKEKSRFSVPWSLYNFWYFLTFINFRVNPSFLLLTQKHTVPKYHSLKQINMILNLLKCRPALIQIGTSLRLLQRLRGTLRCWGKLPMNSGRSPSIWQIIGFSSGDSCSPGLLAEMYWKKVPTDEKEDKKCWWYKGIQQNKDYSHEKSTLKQPV